jgi:DNA-binding MurR/RpiR family transcriptional regulator
LPYYVAVIHPLHNLLSASHQMSEGVFRVAKYITENPDRAASMSIGELAAATGSNKAAVVRVEQTQRLRGIPWTARRGKGCRETIEALQIAKERKIPTIILTSVSRSAAAKLSDTVLTSAVRRSPREEMIARV